jgi:hypothetical protein
LIILFADATTKTFITNYRLEAKLLSFAVAGEISADITARTALTAAYHQAADDIQALWTSTYNRELNKQQEVVSRLSRLSANLAVANRQLHLLQTNLDNPPTCDVDLNTINTPAQARAA